MDHLYFGFILEDNTRLGMGFHVYNRVDFKYCSISQTDGKLLINATGARLDVSEVSEYQAELELCSAAILYFNHLLNSKK